MIKFTKISASISLLLAWNKSYVQLKHKMLAVIFTCQNEVGAAPVAMNWEYISQQPPHRLHNPRDVVKPDVQLNGGRLNLLHILPVVVRNDPEERTQESLAESINQNHPKHKTCIQLLAKHLQPLDRFADEVEEVTSILIFCGAISWIWAFFQCFHGRRFVD